MNQKLPKKLIISLIKDDLKHLKLIGGLNLLGFQSDKAELDISQSVFAMMMLNTNDRRLDHLANEYCERTYIVNDFAGNDSESFERLATEIYNWLALERKKYIKMLQKL